MAYRGVRGLLRPCYVCECVCGAAVVLQVVWASSPPMFFFKPRDFCTVVHYRRLQVRAPATSAPPRCSMFVFVDTPSEPHVA
jgi:hypothetical protein